MCGFTTGYLDLIDYSCTVRCGKPHAYVFVCSCHVFLSLLCVALLLFLPLQCWCLLVLFVIVCRETQLAVFFKI